MWNIRKHHKPASEGSFTATDKIPAMNKLGVQGLDGADVTAEKKTECFVLSGACNRAGGCQGMDEPNLESCREGLRSRFQCECVCVFMSLCLSFYVCVCVFMRVGDRTREG